MDIIKELFAKQDLKYLDFNARLIPNICKDAFIGVRTPQLRALAKEIAKNGEADAFLAQLPHRYFEENQLHAFIVSDIKTPDKAFAELERFLPYIDNWATCDQFMPKVIAKNPELVLDKVDTWLKSDKTYTIRFGIDVLMSFFLDERFDDVYLQKVARIKSDEYYVNMMSAWYFATALAKQYDSTLPYFTEYKLEKWVHNKAISKARESNRVLDIHKEELKKLVIK